MGNYDSCKDCTKRTIGCHSTCKDYKDDVEQRLKIKETRRKERLGTVPRSSKVWRHTCSSVLRNGRNLRGGNADGKHRNNNDT